MVDTDRAAWLQGGDAKCKIGSGTPDYGYRMVLLGAPGIGKGTQAEFLCDYLGTCHLSTGDVFRAAKCMDEECLSPAMKEAIGYMQRGELVPDSTVIDMVNERIHCMQCCHGFLLDGFPRTVAQAMSLNLILSRAGVNLDAVLSYELPVEEVINRLSGRRTCRDCKTTFHIKNKPPKQEGVCDKCGGELYQRDDDTPQAIRVRLEAYESQTSPLKDFYADAGILVKISAQGSPDEVFERTRDILDLKRVTTA